MGANARQGAACNIYRAGLCSVLIRIARRADIGCASTTFAPNSAAIAVLRYTAYRRRSVPACACARGRWVTTGPDLGRARRLTENIAVFDLHISKNKSGRWVPAALAHGLLEGPR